MAENTYQVLNPLGSCCTSRFCDGLTRVGGHVAPIRERLIYCHYYLRVMKARDIAILAAGCYIVSSLLSGDVPVYVGRQGLDQGTEHSVAALVVEEVPVDPTEDRYPFQWEEQDIAGETLDDFMFSSIPELSPDAEDARGVETESGITRLIFIGDTIEYRTGHLDFAGGLENNLEEAMPLLKSADLVILNHEAAPCAADFPASVPQGGYAMGIDPETLIFMQGSGIPLAVNLANNHSGNYGQECLVSGISRLREAGIPVIGAGLDAEEAEQPYVFTDNGNTISFLGYLVDTPLVSSKWLAGDDYPGTLGFTSERLAEGILASPSDSLAVVLLHQGAEYYAGVTTAQLKTAKTVVESGADMIVSTHPHVIEPFLTVNGVPYFSSIGNGVMDGCYVGIPEGSRFPPTRESLILEVQVMDNEVYAIIPHLFYQHECEKGTQRLSALDPSDPLDQQIIDDIMERLIPPSGFNAAGYKIDADIVSGEFSEQ